MLPLAAMPRPPCKPGSEVGDDVSEHIVGDDDIELAGIADHLHAEGVDVQMLRGDFGIFGADFFEHPLPEASGVRHGVGLVAHQNFIARGAIELGVLFAVLEGVADDALDALASIDVFLGGNFVGRALLEHASSIGVYALGVFAEHDEIDIFGLNALQWT